jgi:hypothetical protein
VSSANAPRERFSLGMYRNLSDAERMNLNTQVEDHVAGVRLHYAMQSGVSDTFSIVFEEYRRPEPTPLTNPIVKLMTQALLEKVSERSALAQVANVAPRVSTVREEWQAGVRLFDTQAGAHVFGAKAQSKAHLALDTVDVGGIYD